MRIKYDIFVETYSIKVDTCIDIDVAKRNMEPDDIIESFSCDGRSSFSNQIFINIRKKTYNKKSSVRVFQNGNIQALGLKKSQAEYVVSHILKKMETYSYMYKNLLEHNDDKFLITINGDKIFKQKGFFTYLNITVIQDHIFKDWYINQHHRDFVKNVYDENMMQIGKVKYMFKRKDTKNLKFDPNLLQKVDDFIYTIKDKYDNDIGVAIYDIWDLQSRKKDNKVREYRIDCISNKSYKIQTAHLQCKSISFNTLTNEIYSIDLDLLYMYLRDNGYETIYNKSSFFGISSFVGDTKYNIFTTGSCLLYNIKDDNTIKNKIHDIISIVRKSGSIVNRNAIKLKQVFSGTRRIEDLLDVY
jgi:hypothetical protein